MLEPVTPDSPMVKIGDKFVLENNPRIFYTVIKLDSSSTFTVKNAKEVNYGGGYRLCDFVEYCIIRYRPSYKKIFINTLVKK